MTSITRSTTAPSLSLNARICFERRKINLSQVFAGQNVGVRQLNEHIWLVSFMQYDLGLFDEETYVSGINRHLCDRNTPCGIGGLGRN